MSILEVIGDVVGERVAQDAKWGQQNHPDGTGPDGTILGRRFDQASEILRAACDRAAREGELAWAHILLEEVFEALCEEDEAKLRTELIQTAAVCVAWAEALDRRE